MRGRWRGRSGSARKGGVALVGAAALGMALVLACAARPPMRSGDPGRDAAVLAVLDRYLDALNALDLEGHVATYHFPHFRHASGRIVVWASAREAVPILEIPEADRRRALRDALEPDWHRSEWTRRDIVQADDEKVHVATTFVRLREDGSVIRTFESLYVLTNDVVADGVRRWAIKGRSSFAP